MPVLSVGKIVTSLGKLVSNPKSEEGWETYNKYVVNTAELEQVKYDRLRFRVRSCKNWALTSMRCRSARSEA